jgi:methylmalonyl-CoA mutase
VNDPAAGTENLTFRNDFPPVSREEWEAAIRADLKGADYEKRLVWRSEEGIAVRPYYRADDLVGLDAQIQPPGTFPFARGGGKPWQDAQDVAPRREAVRADQLHEDGATAVQELGYALADGVERLAALADQHRSVDLAAREIEFVFAAGSAFFFEIAKLRAARLLWARVVAEFQPENEAACLMHIQVRTSRRNKSVYDRYTNLLRATTEALSAAIGGCDKLTVEPFGFDEHLASNVQRILREEAHVEVPADPAGGAYLIEVLTDSLAREAWKLFQQVEAAGGYSAEVASGAIAKAVAQSRADREKALALRKKTLVGVNNYPNLMEKQPEFEHPANDGLRLAEPFEKIRERTSRHANAVGRYPRVVMLKRGDLKMRMARANFSLNFFGCAGFEIEDTDQLEGRQADLIVLCSSDPEYLALAREVCPVAKAAVLIAGNPKDQIEELKTAGVQGFIHMQSDAVRTLTEWQDRLGMKE